MPGPNDLRVGYITNWFKEKTYQWLKVMELPWYASPKRSESLLQTSLRKEILPIAFRDVATVVSDLDYDYQAQTI